MSEEKNKAITIRLSQPEKEKIVRLASRCGLSVTEYLKQRALGYEPKAVPPDALFHFLEMLGNLENMSMSTELDSEIMKILNEITTEFLLPGKEKM